MHSKNIHRSTQFETKTELSSMKIEIYGKMFLYDFQRRIDSILKTANDEKTASIIEYSLKGITERSGSTVDPEWKGGSPPRACVNPQRV